MLSLEHFANHTPAVGWSIDELVAAANSLLPQFLPAAGDRSSAAGKVREEVNSRLVRHYAGLGLLDDNSREGREARYGFRHLLQLLLVRRFLIEGYPAAVIAKMIAGKADAELRALLQSGATVTATPANPAMDFLAGVRRRAGLAEPPPLPAVPPPAASPASLAPRSWTRVKLLPGLEMHVREDFQLPAAPHERDGLRQLFLDALQALFRPPAKRPKTS